MPEVDATKMLSVRERAQLFEYSQSGGENYKDMWPAFKFDLVTLPALEQTLVAGLMEQGEEQGVRPFKHISREYLDSHYEALLEQVQSNKYVASLLCLFKEDFLTREQDAVDFLAGLEQQGGSTIAKAIATAPAGYLPQRTDMLLSIRELYGNLARKVYRALDTHYPSGPDSELRTMIDECGLACIGLVNVHGKEAPRIARQYQEELLKLESVLSEQDRGDSFLASLLVLSEELLRECPDDVAGLARVSPFYLPRLLKTLKAEHLRARPQLVYDIARVGKGSVRDAAQALNLLEPGAEHFASRLIFHSGIFVDEALAMRGSQLLEKDAVRHHALLTEYGHAFWGLSDQFKQDLHERVQEHSEFIEVARELTREGAGVFFANLEPQYWNEVGLAFAARYGEAAGYILKQRDKRAFKTELTSDYEKLSAISEEQGNLRWLNRYTRMQLGHLRTTLLESNAENYLSAKPLEATVSVSMLAYADPKNAFGDPVFYDLLSRLDATGTLFLSEVGDLDMIDEQFRKICEDPRRGGSPEKPLLIDQLILGAHCNSYSMQLSGVRHCPPATAKEAEFRLEQMIANDNEERVSAWKKYMAPGSTIILVACSALKPVTDPAPVGKLFEEVFTDSTVLGIRDIGNLEGFAVADNGRIARLDWREGHTWM